jgi:hypothetical protein
MQPAKSPIVAAASDTSSPQRFVVASGQHAGKVKVGVTTGSQVTVLHVASFPSSPPAPPSPALPPFPSDERSPASSAPLQAPKTSPTPNADRTHDRMLAMIPE